SASIYAANSGVSADAGATVVNFGSINGYYGTGVYLKAGGKLTNGSASDTRAVIFSYDGQGVDAVTAAATIVNFATIHSGFGDGVILGAGGVVTNGSTKDTAARIVGETGVVAHQDAATVKNFGTIEGYSAAVGNFGVYLSSKGSVINGAATDTKALIQGVGAGVYASYGASVVNFGTITSSTQTGVVLGSNGQPQNETVTNGSAADAGALIQGKTNGVVLSRFDTLNNFGTVVGQGVTGRSYGVNGGRNSVVNNGSAADATAEIQGYNGVLLEDGFVNNFGTIAGAAASYGVGVLLLDAGSVTNGSASDAAALITGHTGVVLNFYDLNGTVTNFGTISGSGGTAVYFADASQVLVVEAGCAFNGAVLGDGGTLDLDSGNGTLTGLLAGGNVTVSGSMAATTFTDFDTVRIGVAATFVTSGVVRFAAGQSVIAAGSLTLGGAKSTVANAGMIETLGGTVTVLGAVSGKGSAIVDGGLLDFASTFNQNVAFTGTTGTLELAHSQSYGGTIAGLSKTGGTALDLADIAFKNAGEATFSGTKSGGVLTVTDGTHTAHINLAGDYTASTFVAASDGHGGTMVVDPKAKTPSLAQTHSFIAAMAAMSTEGAGPIHPTLFARPANEVFLVAGRHPMIA
ncbi:MAG: hypothetical protein ABI306_10480, partial [Caulobacteraceae bacterium]